jgi:DNA-binding transcriptional regulator YiaG
MGKITMHGTELREHRNRMRMNQTQFGEVVGVHWTTVSDWERGNAEVPHYAALIATIMVDDPVVRDKIEKMVGL